MPSPFGKKRRSRVHLPGTAGASCLPPPSPPQQESSPPPPPEPDPAGAALSSHPPCPPESCPAGAALSSPPPDSGPGGAALPSLPPDSGPGGAALSSPPPYSGPAGAAISSPPPSPPDGPAGPHLAPLPSPRSLVLNHPPVCDDHSRFKLLSLLDCGEDVTSASNSSGRHGTEDNDGQNSGEGAVVAQHRHGTDDNDGQNSGEGALVAQHRHGTDDNDGQNSGEGAVVAQHRHGTDDSDGQNSGEGAVVPQHRHGTDDNDGQNSGEGAVVAQHSSSDDWDGDPFLTDSQGNLTTWRLSDMEAAFEKHLEDEASKPRLKEKKYSKEEILKHNDDRKKQFMEYALQKYNNEEDLAGEMRFVFDEIKEDVYVIEEGLKFYEHFNFTAKQAGFTVLFFAEVVPHGDNCDVLCCKPLGCNDNGRCFACKNQRSLNLRHPADETQYVGGHEDCQFPFMWDSISENDSDCEEDISDSD